MVEEWTGLRVWAPYWEPKHPSLDMPAPRGEQVKSDATGPPQDEPMTPEPTTAIAFIGGPYTQGVNDKAVQFAVTALTFGIAWTIAVSSTGGGAPVTLTGLPLTATSFTTEPMNLTPLNAGTLTASLIQNGSVIATATATLT